MENRNEAPRKKQALVLTLSVSILFTIFCAYQLVNIPADTKNAFLFGLSRERLLMTAGFAVLTLVLIVLLIIHEKLLLFLEKHPIFKWFCIVISITALFFCLMPDYRFGKSAAIYTRLKPYLLWLFLVPAAFAFYYILTQNRFSAVKESLLNIRNQKKFIIPVFFIVLCGILFVEISGIGKTPESALWNKNGIPLQFIQLFCAFFIFALLWKIKIIRIAENKKVLHFFLIWLISAFVWTLAPKVNHFFAPGPYEPNLTFYPYSDAAGYDLPAQTALNGWGFNFDQSLLKPTVVLTSFLSHLMTGNNTTLGMEIQSILYAVLPAIIYLFGSSIAGTGCGYLAAAFSLLKEWNALRTTTVMTINSRLVMSEFLTQILLALFCYAVFHWLKRNGKETLYAIITGGTLALGFFTRYNFFAFFPAVLLILVIGYRKHFRSLVKPLLFFFLAIIMTAAPLLYRERNYSWNIFQELGYTIENVLIKQRFKGQDPFAAEETMITETVQEAIADSVVKPELKSTEESDKIAFPEEKPIKTPVSEKTQKTPEPVTIDFNTSQITQEFSNINSDIKLPLVVSMFNHGFHNIISSILTLPLEWNFQNLEHLYTQDKDGLWSDCWTGSFTIPQWISLGIWLLMGSIAAGILIRMHGISGFSILYFWVVYAFSIGFSRSSGGRYVVPENWIPMLLLAFCCTLILSKFRIEPAEFSQKAQSLPKWQPVMALFVFTAFFGSMLFFEKTLPAKKTDAPEGDLAVLRQRLGRENITIDWKQLEQQIKDGKTHVTHGVAIYPRFYYYNNGEHSANGVLMTKDYSRMTFYGLNKDLSGPSYREYLMPHKDLITDFPQDSIYRAISCKSEYGYEDVLAVSIETPKGDIFTYVRDPLQEFSCPVKEPVCHSVENCE